MRSSTTSVGKRISSRDMPTPEHADEGVGCSKETTEFVNHGLILWNESREKWIGEKKITSRSQLLRVLKLSKLQLCCVNSSKGMHRMLKSTDPFPRPVPLGEMVDFLVNVWDGEGMYDMF
ncbi:hypothetical protein SASPL_115763 [Salvia splendens]|uniref:Gag1-like clamp domain-containing protein n=1 Tax=Salvia splendens TaxID=180675 RepID=A0A8X8Y3S5_SALSN|nr:uncharacterized protein LOC121802145 [Salvia splendens]XP_042057659.1 uncharacterized protein LOC121802145 [Salvia splendens]XP_042057660.1 uncharacterized protein LOC121802145 [Salvia splendens]XP_042057661.1 uncharacterized protein LOC121802145 [Salvia splendens]XP_042057662.1 uncharacterized protein LOC121802145 [Salvia splendens]XP_042057663.1 uncharacterized protein LOC121802145 [Salvia splendens]KAG6425333.1 hypothetical protein SASPL_115763 [Salvia splendens]